MTRVAFRRTLVVGDVHGCYEELLQLVNLAGLGPEHGVIAVGDLVDRGPSSLEVVRFFAADPGRRLSVLGNHEEKHLHGRTDRQDPSGRIVRAEAAAADYEEMLAYFRTMPLWLELPEALVVHAGIQPGVPLESQNPKVVTGRGSQGRRGWDGKTTPWHDDPALDYPKPVIFGHLVTAEVIRGLRHNVWGIDTGAAVGGALTGLLLPDFVTLRVPTPDYYAQGQQRWRDKFLLDDLATMSWPSIERLDLSSYSTEAAAAALEGLARLADLVARVDLAIRDLRASTAWMTLSPEEKAREHQHLRRDARGSASLAERLALEGLASGAAADIVRRRFPTPGDLEREEI